MSVTGLFLILFLLFHMSMNLVAVFSGDAYNAVCEFLGTNWYALMGTAILAVGVIFHFIYAFILNFQNRKARGTERYLNQNLPKGVEWASKNMLILGIIVIVGLGVHLCQFWANMMFAELRGVEDFSAYGATGAADGAAFIKFFFKEWWVVAVYIVWLVALWFHLGHGFWSAFQTIGWNNSKWIPRLKCLANVFSSIIFIGFLVVVIVCHFQA
ncbi:MAG: succinate dehydrogenase cytochrome b subunit [Alphaproteobacteria bacterium]|nr:succinate dehydrogenase cytochrome b subunit [Alphaproteobacteria bacterium]